MPQDNYIKFLGTAGARFVVARQIRYSAGTHIRAGGHDIILDPGPGTLVRCARARPKVEAPNIDAVVLSHAHIDHSNDVNILLDAMATGDHDGGELFCPAECLEGEKSVVFNYARELPRRVIRLEPESAYLSGDIPFRTSPRHVHGMETYGLSFDINGTTISFVTDTDYFPELSDIYADADILVINVVRHYPVKHGNVQHLCADEAKEIIGDVGPDMAVLTHFGMTMIQAGPREVARQMDEELDIPVEAASDGRKIDL